VYRTADDRFLLFILANRVKEWPPLAEALGLAELLADERFATPALIEANAAELKRLISERILGMTLADVGPKLDASGAAWSEIRTLEQVTRDAQVLENGVIVPTPTGDDRIGHSIANPLRFNGSAHVHRRDAPGLGEHTHEVLAEFGFDADAIDALKR
jgi:crotonobetainyl-CoA:carnitine CoA-transferase CaiB-like acyl-CoA transferase